MMANFGKVGQRNRSGWTGEQERKRYVQGVGREGLREPVVSTLSKSVNYAYLA
jgi:hypothetical protein